MFRLVLGDPDLRAFLARERILAYRRDREIVAADEGEELVRLARQARPHMVVMDADRLGAALEPTIAHLRRTPTLKTTPLIVTAARPGEMETRLKGTGVDTVLAKPVGKPALYRLLRLVGPEAGLEIRVAAGLEVGYTDGREPRTGRVVNISTGGLFLGTQAPSDVGAALRIDLALPGFTNRTGVAGVVRWVEDAGRASGRDRPPGMGVQFVDVPSTARRAVGTYVMLAKEIVRVT